MWKNCGFATKMKIFGSYCPIFWVLFKIFELCKNWENKQPKQSYLDFEWTLQSHIDAKESIQKPKQHRDITAKYIIPPPLKITVLQQVRTYISKMRRELNIDAAESIRKLNSSVLGALRHILFTEFKYLNWFQKILIITAKNLYFC